MAINTETLAVAMGYTKSSIAGAGAIAGKPCQIQSITDITDGHRVTFLWVDNNDTAHTSTMDVADGTDGLGIKSVDINGNNHLIITYDDDTTHDAGEVSGGGGSNPTVITYAQWQQLTPQQQATGNYIIQNYPITENVIANPTLAGTEDDLTGLQVGDVKYKVPSGGGIDATIITYAQWQQLTPQEQESGDYIVQNYPGTGGSVSWGGITGTLANQTDLQTALDAKPDIDDVTAASNKVYSSEKVESLYANTVNYTETERQIGTWVDGKPIYSRIFLVKTSPNTLDSHWLDSYNIKSIKSGYIHVWTSNIERISYAFTFNTDNLTWSSTEDSYSNFIYLEYTKTTD